MGKDFFQSPPHLPLQKPPVPEPPAKAEEKVQGGEGGKPLRSQGHRLQEEVQKRPPLPLGRPLHQEGQVPPPQGVPRPFPPVRAEAQGAGRRGGAHGRFPLRGQAEAQGPLPHPRGPHHSPAAGLKAQSIGSLNPQEAHGPKGRLPEEDGQGVRPHEGKEDFPGAHHT